MKRVLLADDDFLALNALYALIEWESYGLTVVYEAHDGISATKYLESHDVDVAIIDMCMPGMDGLALLKHIQEHSPQTICIMLSAYSDYPYVRETLKLGAVDYILKYELTADSLLTLLQQHAIATKKVEPTIQYDEVLQTAIGSDTAPCHIPPGMLLFGRQTRGRIMLEVQQRSIFQTCRHIFHEYTPLGICMPSPQEIIIFLPHVSEIPSSLAASVHQLESVIRKYFALEFSFSAPISIRGRHDLFAYVHAFSGSEKPSASLLSQADRSKLIQAVCAHHAGTVEEVIHRLFHETPDEDLPKIKNQLIDVYYHLSNALENAPSAPIAPTSPQKWEEFFTDLFLKLISSGEPKTGLSASVSKALDFLRKNYNLPFSLSDVADASGLSVSHLSTLFKRQIGMSVLSYNKRLRIYHAAYAILYSQLSITEIADKVGFNGYNHFFTFFREATGMTPTSFKQSASSTAWLTQEKEKLFFSSSSEGSTQPYEKAPSTPE